VKPDQALDLLCSLSPLPRPCSDLAEEIKAAPATVTILIAQLCERGLDIQVEQIGRVSVAYVAGPCWKLARSLAESYWRRTHDE
jgi:hypothetical protein